jgi:uncharacterized ferritin-like protein (DUF455 family)
MSLLKVNDVYSKLALVEDEVHHLLMQTSDIKMAELEVTTPARDLQIVSRQEMPTRMGLQSAEGQARLLHDLANIELQAMELGIRTLHEFASTPTDFRSGLADIVLEEARHLRLCLDGLRELGFEWGHWPTHNTLWAATDDSDSLLDRLLIVNCYLEGSGLDSGELLLKKLSGVSNRLPREIVEVIAREEVGHVRFGLSWYRKFCAKEGLVSSDDFSRRLESLWQRVPARAAPIHEIQREKAGFTETEIDFLKNFSSEKWASARVASKLNSRLTGLESNR